MYVTSARKNGSTTDENRDRQTYRKTGRLVLMSTRKGNYSVKLKELYYTRASCQCSNLRGHVLLVTVSQLAQHRERYNVTSKSNNLADPLVARSTTRR